MAGPSEKEIEEAKRVLRSAYYSGVSSEAADLVRRIFDSEIADENGLHDAVNELEQIYTADQHLTIFASDASGVGLDEAADMGVGNDEVLGPWATLTYQHDITEALEHFSVDLDEVLELDANDRLLWLAHNHGVPIGSNARGDDFLYFVGILNENQRGEVDLGIVRIGPDGNERESTRSFFRRVAPGLLPLAEAAEHRDDKQAMRVLRDALNEAGLNQSPPDETDEPTYQSGRHRGRR